MDLRVPGLAVMLYVQRLGECEKSYKSFKCVNFILEFVDKMIDYDLEMSLQIMEEICIR